MKLGLFEQLFWRLLALLGAAFVALALFSQYYYQRHLYDAWQADLRQEAQWTALHWSAAHEPERLADAWQRTHDVVRLTILDAQGKVIADSTPEAPPIGAEERSDSGRLSGTAPIEVPGTDGKAARGTLVLSRHEPQGFFVALHRRVLVFVIVLVALCAVALYPLVRGVRTVIARVATQARRVADGELGATIAGTNQRELGMLVSAFNDMSIRLRDEDLRRQRLIVDVSHELRSPLARLRALGETIERRPEEAGPHLRQLDAEIALLDRLVGDLLDAARFEQVGASLALETVSVRDWASATFARLARRIEQAGAACGIEGIEGLDEEVRVGIDPQRLLQAIANAVENAITAVGERATPQIRLGLSVEPGSWTIRVADNGRGIPAPDLPHVFDRFYRAERDRDRRTGGVGLGLAIAKAIVEAHGGGIAIESTVGIGTTVRITLPRDPRPAPSS